MFESAASYLKRVIDPASRAGRVIGAVLLVVLVLLTVADVVLRHFFNSPIHGTLEITELNLSIIVFLSLAYCAVKGTHVVVDVVVNQFSERIQTGLSAFVYFCSAATLGVLSWQLSLYALKLQDMNRVSAILRLPAYPFAIIAVIGCALLALAFFMHFLYTMAEARKQ